MSSEETLIEIRKQKHQEINGGKYALATEYSPHDNCLRWPIGSYFEKADYIWSTEKPLDYKMMARGRISAFRKSGGITFVKVTDTTGSLQIIFSKASFVNYEGLKLFDLGDIVEVFGQPIISKTGEKSIMADDMNLLTKAHRPPPEKFLGIADQELKYRKRYLDLMSSEETRARFTVRSHVLRAIRSFMESKEFMEVETSTLNSISSGASAKPFITHHNELEQDMFLRIAPELYLKRLLVGGYSKVYEIGRNYRNEGISTRHNPEFTMMEFYEAYGSFPDLIVYTKALLRHVREHLRDNLPVWAKPYFEKWDAESPFSLSQFVEVPMWDAVIHAAGKAELLFDPSIHPLVEAASDRVSMLEVTNPNNERLQKIDMKGLFHALNESSSNGERIYALFEYLAEPFLTEDYRSGDGLHSCPVFITQYPKAVSPLARAHDKCPLICERFELFVEGRELANAFQELNDPDEQAERFHEQLETNQKDPMDYDADYVEALEYGMPPAIGFGMGIDRLVMLLTNTTSIKDVILFPTLKRLNNA